MKSTKRFFTTIVVLLLALVTNAFSSPRYVGPGSCSSSNCHGNNKPLNSSNVLQNEYTTWSKHDRHSKAYLSLLNSESKKIASNLSLGDPSKEPLCLKCHATYEPIPSQRGEKFSYEDGVSCESCHGAAEGWLKSHAVAETSHADNVAQGLRDLSSLPERAALCLSCHYGTEEKMVNHALYGAGHPRLSFELDTFGILQPKHWVVDKDYEERKGPYVPMRAWLIGQVTQAQATLAALSSSTRSRDGTFPELSLFDCFSCHHSLTEDQWKRRSYGGKPGRLKLNLPSLIILREVSKALNRSIGEELSRHISTLHDSYKKDGAADTITALQALLSSKVEPLLASLPPDNTTTTRVLSSLASYATSTPWPTFEVAEQLGMGMQATVASSPELAKSQAAHVKELFATLKSSESFAPERFVAAARKIGLSGSTAKR